MPAVVAASRRARPFHHCFSGPSRNTVKCRRFATGLAIARSARLSCALRLRGLISATCLMPVNPYTQPVPPLTARRRLLGEGGSSPGNNPDLQPAFPQGL